VAARFILKLNRDVKLPSSSDRLAGALKKKLELEVTSEKVEDRGRVYKLPAA